MVTDLPPRDPFDPAADADDPAEFRVKADLARRVAVAIEDQALDTATAALAAGIDDGMVKRIKDFAVSAFSVWDLMKIMASLGHDIAIEITGTDGGPGEVYVVADTGELADLDLGPGDGEIPKEYQWSSDDEDVTDEQRGAGDTEKP